MSEVARFFQEVAQNIADMGNAPRLQAQSNAWLQEVTRHKYVYNFTWMGRPIIQLPQDIVALQELIWKIRPDLIIETGIAHGGSLIFSASMLELLGGDGQVLGIDIDIREHNRAEIEKHPMYKRITLLQGSSIAPEVIEQVYRLAKGKERILVILDSNHTHDHVLRELELYSPLVTCGSYLVVFDTLIDDLPDALFVDRPWGKGNNPKTAIRAFMKHNDRFVIDKQIDYKLQLSAAPDGYLKCVKD